MKNELAIARTLIIILLQLALMNPLFGGLCAILSKSSGSTNSSFHSLQEWDLKRSFRLSGLIGFQIVDGPYQEVTDVYALAIHWRVITTELIYGNLVLEAAYGPGRKAFEFELDENESIRMDGLNTTVANLNFEVIGMTWQSHNPLKILPYTTLGIGTVFRPEREIITTYHIDDPDIPESQREQQITVKMHDCGKNAGSINLGVGFQIYYVSRLDFRIFLVKPGRIALYRMGLVISF